MAINLNAPLRWTASTPEQEKMLQNLQGNILKGHGRRFTSNIFFRIDTARLLEAKRVLREVANFHVTNAHRQLLDAERFKSTGDGGGPFTHVSLTFKGYQALNLAAAAPADPDFQAGMTSNASVAALKDPPVNTWEAPFQQVIHALVLVAHETEEKRAALTALTRELLENAGCTIVHVQHGEALFNAAEAGIEHFGYVDGRSQPLMLVEDIERETANGGASRWDPAFPLSTVLVKDPGTSDTFSFGSFLVFRKLEQDVRGFKRQEQLVADTLGLTSDSRELAGALIVGRFEDGTPVTLANTPRSQEPQNDFNYVGDPSSRCPFHAHIRKVNPRGTGGAEPEAQERLHIMARRGIPFQDVKRPLHPEELPEGETLAEFDAAVGPLLPTSGVGLLFMAYNRILGQQFKFTQQIWANNPAFPIPGTHGIDPVIGQGVNTPGDQKLAKVWDAPGQGSVNNAPFSGFVKMRGGEYFFSPSLTFLRNV
jgi:Dyp-type peroxidase family